MINNLVISTNSDDSADSIILSNNFKNIDDKFVKNKKSGSPVGDLFIEPVKYKFLKMWIIAIIAITLIYFIYWYMNYEMHPVAYYNINRQNYLRTTTPAYPPPLVNFMDVPDVWNDKYVKAGDII